MSTTTITGLITVAVPVSDQDAAKAIFEGLGFRTTMDSELQPGFRWLELSPPDGGVSIALVATGPDLPTGIDTGIRLATADARAAHATVQDLGLAAGELLLWDTAPPMFSFADLDGNQFYVTQTTGG